MYEIKKDLSNPFNKIFLYENKKLQVVGNAFNPFFKTDDVLNILNFTDKKKHIDSIHFSLKKTYKELSSIFKFQKNADDVNEKKNINTNSNKTTNNLTDTNNLKDVDKDVNNDVDYDDDVYLNEAGLYYITTYTTNIENKKFQNYILNYLLPSLKKNDKFDIFISQNNEFIKLLEIQNNKIDKLNDNISHLIDGFNNLVLNASLKSD